MSPSASFDLDLIASFSAVPSDGVTIDLFYFIAEYVFSVLR